MLVNYKFTASDLEANRQGHLSEHQIERLRRNRLGQALMIYFFAAIFAGLLAVIISLVFSTLIVVLVVLIVLLIATRMAFPAWKKYTEDIISGVPQSLTGPIRLNAYSQSSGRSRTMVYELTVQRNTFRLSENNLRSLHDQETYCVYYAPQSETFLSASRLEPSALSDRGVKNE